MPALHRIRIFINVHRKIKVRATRQHVISFLRAYSYLHRYNQAMWTSSCLEEENWVDSITHPEFYRMCLDVQWYSGTVLPLSLLGCYRK